MKKTDIKLTVLFLLFALCMILLSGCGTDDGKIHNNGVIADKYTADGTDFDNEIKATWDFVPVAENDELILLVNGSTAEIKVVDKTSGSEWYSNPQKRFDFDFVGETKSVYSQLYVEYNINDSANFMNSYLDAVLNYQYSFSPIENGLRVNFVMGTKPRTYLVPQLIEKERFEELLTHLNESEALELHDQYILIDMDEMQENDRMLLIERFPSLQNTTAYITQLRTALLSPSFGGAWPLATDYYLEQIESILIKAGYTQEEFNQYVADNNLPESVLSDTSIAMSIEYQLDGNQLVARVPYDSIAFQESELQLRKITMLPAFGAAYTDKNGYIFVPDGCGAIAYLNRAKENTSVYSAMVYDRDITLPQEQKKTAQVQSTVYLPVFGIKSENQSFLAIIEEGDALAEITSQVSSEGFTCNAVKATFCMNYVQHPTTIALSANAGLFYQEAIADTDLVIRYCFQYGDDANYVGMAESYRNYLLMRGKLQQQEIEQSIPLFLDIVQAINGKKNVLGIPVDRPLALTTNDQVIKILSELSKCGVSDVDVELQGWANGGYYHTAMNEVELMSELGGQKSLNRLTDYAKSNGITLFPSCNFQVVPQYETWGSFSAVKHAARTLENVMSYQSEWKNTFGIQTPVQSSRDGLTVSPAYYEEMIRSFMKEYAETGLTDISAGSLGYALGGDYREEFMVTRQKAKGFVQDGLKILADSTDKLAIEGGNVYTLENANYVYDLTMDSSGHNALDETVPFYQIVLHGVIPYAGEPANKVSDSTAQCLRFIETGTIPAFMWIYEENVVLKNTAYTKLNSTNYLQWFDKAVEMYNEVNEALMGCADATIIAHEILSDAVHKTVYSNGITIYVNYSSETQTIDGVTVQPTDYLRVEKGW